MSGVIYGRYICTANRMNNIKKYARTWKATETCHLMAINPIFTFAVVINQITFVVCEPQWSKMSHRVSPV